MPLMDETSHEKQQEDVERVAKEAESILRCSIFKLLERVIEQECDSGQLDFSSIAKPITEELKQIKKFLDECEEEDDEDNDIDDYVHHKVVRIIDAQLETTLKLHHKTFYKLTAELDLSSEFSFAYDSFVRICRRLMQDEITWFRVVSLLCFSAEVAVVVIKKGGPGVESFLKKIVHYVVEFILKEKVADWISHHGGWVTMVNFFDSQDCPHRAEHLISLIALTETSSFEKWTRRIALSTAIIGVGLIIGLRYINQS